MFTSLTEGLMADEPTRTKQRPDSAHAGAVDGMAASEQSPALEEGFNWGRIRRLSKKG